MPRGLAAEGRDPLGVAERVLGHRAGVTPDVDHDRLAGGPEQLPELAADQADDGVVVEVEQLGLHRAPDEGPEQDRAGGGAAGGPGGGGGGGGGGRGGGGGGGGQGGGGGGETGTPPKKKKRNKTKKKKKKKIKK